jgi:hypothetical protein
MTSATPKAVPRTIYHPKHGAKEFPSGGAAKRAIDLDPKWSLEPPRGPKRRRWFTLWLLRT